MKLFIFLMCAGASAWAELPVVTLRSDDTEIRQSCRLEIPPGTVLADTNGDGVVHIAASDIVIELAPSAVLRGAAEGTPPDQYRGYAIRLQGQKNVTIRGGRISGFHGAIWATACNGLTIEDLDASDNRRARLKSDPQVESNDDWLYPHHNDDNHWLNDYAAALYVEDSSGITVRRCRVHHGQNALCLDRVNESRIYDNDFSFNSGWGIAMWRASRNVITRNACDFCIRGYSHGVYNRGEDSAGFLVFEQCSDNVIAENSATHGGDALFGFAGNEGQQGGPASTTRPAATQPTDSQPTVPTLPALGCDRNLLIRNDFSYAAAHGIEMTFSFGNRYLANRLVGNAICGVWNGYSQDTLIASNEIAENGETGYGLERGGINIDSSRRNRIVHNTFRDNRCGVHLWWAARDQFGGWATRNCPDWSGNLIADNTFTGDILAFHLRGPGEVTLARNQFTGVRREEIIEGNTAITRDDALTVPPLELPTYPVFGETRPVGARPQLRGREHIIMTEWGPWDHASPLVRRIESDAAGHAYALWCLPAGRKITLRGTGVSELIRTASETDPNYLIVADKPGVYPYELTVEAGDFHETLRGTLVSTTWQVTEFPWTKNPEEDLEGWRSEAQGPAATTEELHTLWIFRSPDPLDVTKTPPPPTSAPAGGRPRRGTRPHVPAGLIARTKLLMPAGTWRLALVGNGGIRLQANGETVINDWARSWMPRRSVGVLKLSAPREVELVVEQQRDQLYMALALEIMPGE